MKIFMIIILLFSISYLSFGQEDNLLVSNDWNELNQALNLRRPNLSNELENNIASIIDKINRVTGLNTKYWISANGPIFSHPVFGIILNIQELEIIFEKSTVEKISPVISLIIAHEIAHQLQFQLYGSEKILTNCKEMKKVYECQADILAGKILAEMPSSDFDESSITDALKILYNIGTPEYSFSASHPSHEDRRFAVNIGIKLGKLTKVNKAYTNLNASLNEIQDLTARKILNIEYSETSMSWSLRQAKRIINYCMINSENIEIQVQDVYFNPSGNSPTVEYIFKYSNSGNDLVNIDMEVQSVTVQRMDMLNTLKWSKTDGRSYKFSLSPGQSYAVKGTLKWNRTKDDEIPILVYPPAQQQLISFEGSECNCNSEISELSPSRALQNFSINQTFALALQDLMEAAKNHYEGFLVGPYKYDEVLKNKVYQTSLNLPGLEAAKIDFSKLKKTGIFAIWSSTAYSGYSLNMARDKYREMIKTIRQALKDSELEFTESIDNESNSDASSPSYSFELKEFDGNIVIMLDETFKGQYSVNVSL